MVKTKVKTMVKTNVKTKVQTKVKTMVKGTVSVMFLILLCVRPHARFHIFRRPAIHRMMRMKTLHENMSL